MCLFRKLVFALVAVAFVGVGSTPIRGNEAPELVLEAIDLPSWPGSAPLAWSLVPPILPGSGQSLYTEVEMDVDESEGHSEEMILDFIRELVQPDQWDLAGRRLDLVDGVGVMRAPQSVIDETKKLLAYMNRRVYGTVEVQLTVYQANSSDVKIDQGAILSNSDADALVSRGRESAGWKKVLGKNLLLRSGQPVMETSQTFHSFLADYDLEIADSSVIADPVVSVVGEGVTVHASGSRARDGSLLLDLSLRLMRLENIAEENLGCTGLVLGGDRGLYPDLPATLQSPDRNFATLVSSFHVPRGKSAFLTSSSRLFSGGRNYVVRVDSKNSASDVTSGIELSSGRYFAAFDLEAAQLGRIQMTPANHGDLDISSLDGAEGGDGGPPLSAYFSGRSVDPMTERIHETFPGFEEGDSNIWNAGNWIFVSGDRALINGIDAMISGQAKRYRDSGTVEFLLERRTGESVQRLGHFVLPVTLGVPFSAVAGNQWLHVLDYDVEVAQKAAGGDPWVGVVYDAMHFRGTVTKQIGGGYSFALQGKAHVLQEPSTIFDPKVRFLGGITMPSVTTFTVDRSLDLSAGRPAVLTGLSGDLGDSDVVLQVTFKK